MQDLIKADFKVENNIHIILKDKKKNFLTIQDFYHKNPFPNYKKNDDKMSILSLGNKNLLAKNLKEKIGLSKRVLEVGSGTCQLSNYLAIGTNNQIYCLDASVESLKLGAEFAEKNNLKNLTFVNGDIFDEIFHKESFDYIVCNGVLHHTGDTYKAFDSIVRYLKNDGLVLVGLYNKYGRLRTNIRRMLYNLFGEKIIYILDPVIRNLAKNENENQDKIDAWMQDQYIHPIEQQHSVDEVLNCFNKNNINFISSVPPMNFSIFDENKMFDKQNLSNYFYRILRQILMIIENYGAEGGLFIMVGKNANNK